jgi:anaerobic selenocysteine-containing dehydrogenase
MATRRNFLALGAATATVTLASGAALTSAKERLQKGGKDFSPQTGKSRKALPTACWQCVSRCSVVGYV